VSDALPDDLTMLARMTRTELRLAAREPLVLSFVFAFPVVLVLVLGGIFEEGDTAFEGAVPSDFYAAAYVAVAIGAIGLVMLPSQIASYRERGVLRRFRAAGIAGWVFPTAMSIVSLVMTAIAAVLVIVTSAFSYGVPAVEAPVRTVGYGVLAAVSFVSFGTLLGWLMPSSRSAQGVGLTLFIPMFLLGGGGPPPEAQTSAMRTLSDYLPLTHVLRAIQEPWLGIGNGNVHAVVLVGIFIVSTAGWAWLSRQADDS
jgi:ABC-2 type transport system permease protein